MNLDRFSTIHSEIVDDALGVQFGVRIESGGKKWDYRGSVGAMALTLLGGSAAFKDIFDANRGKFELRALRQWDAQPPETFEFIVDSTNYQDGGGFVNNG